MEWKFKGIWRYKVPPTVKIFALLLGRNKILTREVVHRRGINCDTKCEMCDTEEMETSVHLLFHYPYAKQVWDTLEVKLGITLAIPKESVQCTWEASWRQAKQTNGMSEMKWTALFLGSCWLIWKQRNDLFFRGSKMQLQLLATRIIHEAFFWLDNG